jgi:hypothetical protein
MGDGVWLAGWWPVSGVTNTPTTHEAGLSTVSDSVHTRCRPATMQPTVSYTLFMLIGDGMPPRWRLILGAPTAGAPTVFYYS